VITSDALPPDLDALVRDELGPGERPLWAAQPLAGRTALQACLIWLFAVPWTAFSVFWTVMAASAAGAMDGWGVIFPLWGTPFVAVGLAMLSAPVWAWRGARRTLYAVTDRRAVVFTASGFRGISVRTFAPAALADVRRTERPDGSGDLVFSRTTTVDSDGDRSTTDAGFLNVADVRGAEGAVRALTARPTVRA
jgi:hypothetical protein